MPVQIDIEAVENSALTPDRKAELTALLKLQSRSSAQMESHDLKRAREAAGLSIEQAAGLIPLDVRHLERFELAGGWTIGSVYHPLVRAIDRVYGLAVGVRRCRHCGCTDDDCSECFARIGKPCCWIEKDLCSACASRGLF